MVQKVSKRRERLITYRGDVRRRQLFPIGSVRELCFEDGHDRDDDPRYIEELAGVAEGIVLDKGREDRNEHGLIDWSDLPRRERTVGDFDDET